MTNASEFQAAIAKDSTTSSEAAGAALGLAADIGGAIGTAGLVYDLIDSIISNGTGADAAVRDMSLQFAAVRHDIDVESYITTSQWAFNAYTQAFPKLVDVPMYLQQRQNGTLHDTDINSAIGQCQTAVLQLASPQAYAITGTPFGYTNPWLDWLQVAMTPPTTETGTSYYAFALPCLMTATAALLTLVATFQPAVLPDQRYYARAAVQAIGTAYHSVTSGGLQATPTPEPWMAGFYSSEQTVYSDWNNTGALSGVVDTYSSIASIGSYPIPHYGDNLWNQETWDQTVKLLGVCNWLKSAQVFTRTGLPAARSAAENLLSIFGDISNPTYNPFLNAPRPDQVSLDSLFATEGWGTAPHNIQEELVAFWESTYTDWAAPYNDPRRHSLLALLGS